MIIIDPDQVFDFVVSGDRDSQKKDQSTFKIKAMTAGQQEKFMLLYSGLEEGDTEGAIAISNRIVSENVIGWENVRTSMGKEIKFSPELVCELIPVAEKAEIVEEIQRLSGLSEEEEGK